MPDYELALVANAEKLIPTTVVADYVARSGEQGVVDSFFHAWHLPIVTRLLLSDDGKERGVLLSRASNLNPDAQQILFYHALSDDNAAVLLVNALAYLQSNATAIFTNFAPAEASWTEHLSSFRVSHEARLRLALERLPAVELAAGYSVVPLSNAHLTALLPLALAHYQASWHYLVQQATDSELLAKLRRATQGNEQAGGLTNLALLYGGQPVGYLRLQHGDEQGEADLLDCVVGEEHRAATTAFLSQAIAQLQANEFSSLLLDSRRDDPDYASYLALGAEIEAEYDTYYWWRDGD